MNLRLVFAAATIDVINCSQSFEAFMLTKILVKTNCRRNSASSDEMK